MPRSAASQRLETAAAQLEQAAGLLGESGTLSSEDREAYLESAHYVRLVAGPGGWRRLQASGGSSGPTKNMALTLDKNLKGALVAASEEFETPLSQVVAEGFQAVLNGTWTPPRVPRNLNAELATLNVRVDKGLADQVQALAVELQERLGYRVNQSRIAVSYLAWDLGVEQPGVGEDVLYLALPKPLAEYLESRAASEGVTLREVAEDGIRALLDGSWSPEFTERPRTASGTYKAQYASGPNGEVERAGMSIRVDGELLDSLREWVARMAQDVDFPMHPGKVVRRILTDRLGDPAA
ncbi:hypothetical protein DMH12_15315 [Streptomyces sp. WAC 04229]|uniref:hypothetical protein n=1 Tax=Streptomyces sp. WAC 04229 TaxID=2203206 RepID=UPI000F74404D|nr:hypothetical protein [Streptomyces sp. WAC 04229]RSN55586.1 hypothetical protein DMH12_15315 [Streptomyces sp. WAC 04229]